MVDRQSAWAATSLARSRARTGLGAAAKRGTILRRLEIHPLIWLRGYPLVLPTLLIAIAALMYMLQVNQSSLSDFRLQSLQNEQTQKAGEYAQYAAALDRLTSCQHVCSVALNKLHMDHPNLTSALWINVQLPVEYPRLPKQPAVQTGPLSWLQDAATAVRNSL